MLCDLYSEGTYCQVWETETLELNCWCFDCIERERMKADEEEHEDYMNDLSRRAATVCKHVETQTGQQENNEKK